MRSGCVDEGLVPGVVQHPVEWGDKILDHLVEFVQAAFRESSPLEHLSDVGALGAIVGSGDIHELFLVVPLVDDDHELPGLTNAGQAGLPVVAQFFHLSAEGISGIVIGVGPELGALAEVALPPGVDILRDRLAESVEAIHGFLDHFMPGRVEILIALEGDAIVGADVFGEDSAGVVLGLHLDGRIHVGISVVDTDLEKSCVDYIPIGGAVVGEARRPGVDHSPSRAADVEMPVSHLRVKA